MKNYLLKRVERIEQRTLPCEGITAIFRRLVTPGQDRPVNGWSYDNGAERVTVLRQAGETGDDLEERAVTLARECVGRSNIPSLTSIM